MTERRATPDRRDLVVLGSTGSIGTQALDVVRANPDRFRVVGLTAGGSRPDLFDQQVEEFRPAFAGLGEQASVEAAAHPCDVVLNGMTGAVGLRPTLAALDAGTTWSGRCTAAWTSGPPATSDSLFASARVRPADRAASVGARPTDPVMPLSTTSQGQPASSVAASGPARIFGTA